MSPFKTKKLISSNCRASLTLLVIYYLQVHSGLCYVAVGAVRL